MSSNLAYQDDFAAKRREELVDGKTVMMSPRPSVNHSQVASNIYYLFAHYLRKKTCRPFADGVDLYLDEDNQFIPDFMVVCDPDKIKPDGVHGAPDLVVEVLSPSTAKDDRTRKKEVYEACGVPEYWLVSPTDKSIEVYLLESGKYILHDVYTVRPDWVLKQMTDEERAAIVTEFKCHLYDDLIIRLDDIFGDLF